jgi:hypothetical protein
MPACVASWPAFLQASAWLLLQRLLQVLQSFSLHVLCKFRFGFLPLLCCGLPLDRLHCHIATSSTHMHVGGAGSSQSTASALQKSADSWDALARAIPADLDTQPAALQGVHLHSYQMHGLRWLLGLHDLGLNGILADDMGELLVVT